jgi:hypothetical protein
MSHQMVGNVIQRLLTDEHLRLLFALDPIEALADLSVLGFALTPDEIDVFIRTDARLWFWTPDLVGEQVH